jgi:hypothetical protein
MKIKIFNAQKIAKFAAHTLVLHKFLTDTIYEKNTTRSPDDCF